MEWDSDEDEDGAPPWTIRIQHTKVYLGDSGGQSMQNSYLSCPASPSKNCTVTMTYPQYFHEGFLDHHAAEEAGYKPDCGNNLTTDDKSDNDLDPAYKHHLTERDCGENNTKQQQLKVSTVYI